METRALAIAFFYAVGTAVGGITGPLLFGKLIETAKETNVFWGYVLGASLMIVAGIVQALIGVEAARRDLEDIATPLSAEAAEGDDEEVAALAAALGEAGSEGLDRRTLGERVNCRLWGPGRYRRDLSIALARDEISQSARGRFVAERETVWSGR